jgi:hypothetical protein
MRESDIEDYLVEQVEYRGGLTRKLGYLGMSNAPDRLIVLNGSTVLCEVKRPGKKLRHAQDRERQRLVKAGAWATWVSTYEEVDALLDEIMAQFNLRL